MQTREAIQFALDAIMNIESDKAKDARETLLAILDQKVNNPNGTLCDEMDLIIFG